ncbi:ATP-binding protein [Aliihoeflea sp. 40Bstr573]|uniref:ATP-binding protein n=1 Tax=Aliihoeflea sp. 40Bstr573 TaxID=2696467 RepID=UPI00209559C9|nr:DNA-binding protein [Aliihoeflea sp. 40Bstr573]MCO6389388.1 DNA-binding protein [Aliihoeflea sp. 40Bstr573]
MEAEARVRETVLTSVQGEVEAITGGRRIALILEACKRELDKYVTPTGRPKSGSIYLAVTDRVRTLSEKADELKSDVDELREALDLRRSKAARLSELERPEDVEMRRRAWGEAQAAFDAAKLHEEKLGIAESQAVYAREKRDAAKAALDLHDTLLSRQSALSTANDTARTRRDTAMAERQKALALEASADEALQAAETAQDVAQDLLRRLNRSFEASQAADKLRELRTSLATAEETRREVEAGEAELRALQLPEGTVRAAHDLDVEIAGLKAAAQNASTVAIDYTEGPDGSVSVDGDPLSNGERRPISGATIIAIAGIGRLTVEVPASGAATRLAEAISRRTAFLQRLDVASMAEIHARDAAFLRRSTEIEIERRTLAFLAPNGMAALSDEIMKLETRVASVETVEGDRDTARAQTELANARLEEVRASAWKARPARKAADESLIEAERALAAVAGELVDIENRLGPVEMREGEGARLRAAYEAANADLHAKEAALADSNAKKPDMANVEATLARTRSVVEAATRESQQLHVELAGLNARIDARAQEAVEEELAEVSGTLATAKIEVARVEREVFALTRLRDTLEEARQSAREHYFEPIMRELKPLLTLLFEDAEIDFDDETLLPRSIRRKGQTEEIERLSGGMREQLAVLTRLAFARLLARDGRPTPVILDDALVYSDDDRIERMFDALHRQARDQQIIVFSCRQRAFSALGGNALNITDWVPRTA